MEARPRASFIIGLAFCGWLACGDSHRGLLLADAGRHDGSVDVSVSARADVGLGAGEDVSPDVAGLASDAAEVVDLGAVATDLTRGGADLPGLSTDLGTAGAGTDTAVAADLPGQAVDLRVDAARVDLTPTSPAFDAAIDSSTPTAPSPSGGCVPGVVTPSLAFYGVTGIDFDEDGIPDDKDVCPSVAGSNQADGDGDGMGDACDRCNGGPDTDRDGICDAVDNCPVDWNPGQYDIDGNHIGNRCDAQRCSWSNGNEQTQQVLQRLLRRPELAAALDGAHWRIVSTDDFCTGNELMLRLAILDYRHRKQISVDFVLATDTLRALKITDLADLLGPQPSAEEGQEAMYMAEHDPHVRAVLDSLTGLISPGPFFYEFGTQPETNDPAFPSCATGRCIDVLYDGRTPDGGYASYSVVVEMDACKVLGVRER